MKKITGIFIAMTAAIIMSVAAYADDGYFFAESAMYRDGKLYTNIEGCGDVSLENAYSFYVTDSYILYVVRNADERTSVLHCCNIDMTNDRIVVNDIWGGEDAYYYNDAVYYTKSEEETENIYRVDLNTGENAEIAEHPNSYGWIEIAGIENGCLHYSINDFWTDAFRAYKLNLNNIQDKKLMYYTNKMSTYSAFVDNNKLYINTAEGIKVMDTENGQIVNTLNDNNAVIVGIYNDTVYLSDDYSVWKIGSDNVLGYMSTNDKLNGEDAVGTGVMQDNIIYFTLNPEDFYGYIPEGKEKAVCTFDVLTNTWEIFE